MASNQISAGQGMLGTTVGTLTANTWPSQNVMSGTGVAGSFPYVDTAENKYHFTVEKVDNGYIFRAAKYQGGTAKVKVCATADELRDIFISTLVEYQLDK